MDEKIEEAIAFEKSEIDIINFFMIDSDPETSVLKKIPAIEVSRFSDSAEENFFKYKYLISWNKGLILIFFILKSDTCIDFFQ